MAGRMARRATDRRRPPADGDAPDCARDRRGGRGRKKLRTRACAARIPALAGRPQPLPDLHTMRTTLSLSLFLFAAAAPAVAQRVVAYDPFAGTLAETQPPTAILPALTPPQPAYPSVPVLPAPGALVPVTADATTNTITGITWFTNGVLLASMPSPSFPAPGPVVPPFAIAPAVLAMVGGAVTGIALDPIANIMWLCGMPGVVVGVVPVPGTPVAVPPFPLLFPTGPLAGLEWDGMSGSLLAVDVAGIVYRFLPGGAPVAPPIVGGALAIGPAGDVAIDKSGIANAAGVRAIWVSFGPMAMDVTMPSPPFPLGVPVAPGLAYLPRPASNPPVGGCACGAMLPLWNHRGPMTAGNAGFGLSLSGLAPGQLTLFAFDFVFNPAFPLINGSGCRLGLMVPSGTMVTAIAFANAVGVAGYPLPLFAPPGFGPLYEQSFTTCAADPAGFAVAPLLQLAAGGT